jgi:diguanylate cyclase (GGDEF)-like protein
MLGCEDLDVSASPDEWFTRVHRDDIGAVREGLESHLATGRGAWESEHRMMHRNGTFRWVLCRAAAIRDGAGIPLRLAGSLVDITETKVADALTGLPNRARFVRILQDAIERAAREHTYAFAVLVVRLESLSIENLGPLTADRLLVAVADRLQWSVRSSDIVCSTISAQTVARVANEEFTVLLDNIADERDAVRVAVRLADAIEEPYYISGGELLTSSTIGIASSLTGYTHAEDMLRHAGSALRRAQVKGVGCELHRNYTIPV